MPGVTGTTSVDRDLRAPLRRVSADAPVPCERRPVTSPDFGVFLTVVGASSMMESSSGASFGPSRIGETVLATLLLFSTVTTFSARSGLSSSSSSSSLSGATAADDPRFRFPNRGVTTLSFGVALRRSFTLRGAERLRCRLADPLELRGVLCAGVRDRRPERCGGREACFAPKAPKSKPKDACTVEALISSVYCASVL
jgi:hypothetical protein